MKIETDDIQRLLQWFHVVQDVNPSYVEPGDHLLAKRLADHQRSEPDPKAAVTGSNDEFRAAIVYAHQAMAQFGAESPEFTRARAKVDVFLMDLIYAELSASMSEELAKVFEAAMKDHFLPLQRRKPATIREECEADAANTTNEGREASHSI